MHACMHACTRAYVETMGALQPPEHVRLWSAQCLQYLLVWTAGLAQIVPAGLAMWFQGPLVRSPPRATSFAQTRAYVETMGTLQPPEHVRQLMLRPHLAPVHVPVGARRLQTRRHAGPHVW